MHHDFRHGSERRFLGGLVPSAPLKSKSGLGTVAFLVAILSTLTAPPLQAQLVEHYRFDDFGSSPGLQPLVLPDGNGGGVSDARVITGSGIAAIGSLTIDLSITAEFNGDLYIYLRHESSNGSGGYTADGFAVLLNRPGRTAENAYGYADSGFTITLDDHATYGNIHTYQNEVSPTSGSPLLGSWKPDGRAIDPSLSLETTATTTSLADFTGVSGDGRWTLFAVDAHSGGMSEINEWQLNISAVPEPSACAVAVAFSLVALVCYRRARS